MVDLDFGDPYKSGKLRNLKKIAEEIALKCFANLSARDRYYLEKIVYYD